MNANREIGTAAALLQRLDACAREPIHKPGSIQPHGMLLVANARDLTIIGGAGELDECLQPAWLGRSLRDLLAQDVSAKLAALPDSVSVTLDQVRGPAELFDAVAHRVQAKLIVELERAPSHPLSAAQMLSSLEVANRIFERADNLRELCKRAATAFRRLTGFDRVMVYQFLDDDAGVVLAEDRDPASSSFLNHHFPASDVPRQARALYVRNRVRVIPDVNYIPAPLRSASGELADLDMSDVALRSVSPIHIQYLKNMAVAASASVSIIRDGVLWGLIACHNASPKRLSYDIRLACEALAGGLARQIRTVSEAEIHRERTRLRSLEDTVAARLGTEASFGGFFGGAGRQLCEMLQADGFAAVQGEDLHTAGRCPDDTDVRDLANWVQDKTIGQPFSTHELSACFPAAAAYQNRTSGLLATAVLTEQPTILLWFRAERIEIVNWAGNPHKSAPADPETPLSPRASFEAWSDTVRGRSQPWKLLETESASRLIRILLEARQNRRIRDLNRELTATVADNERLLLQKDYLLKEVSHRTLNSLQLVSSFLSMQADAVGDRVLSGHLNEAQRRVMAVALVHRRLYSDERIEKVDLSRYLSDLCVEICESMDPAWREQVSLLLVPIIVSADKAVQIGLILTELVINANKYAYGGGPGPISIVLEQHRNRFRLIVADSGSGRAGTREGFGSRMLSAMVKSLAGELEEGSNDPGLRLIVTAPFE